MSMALRREVNKLRNETANRLINYLKRFDDDLLVVHLLGDAQDKRVIMAGLDERMNANDGSLDAAVHAMFADSIYRSERHTAFYVELMRTNESFDLGDALRIAFYEAPKNCRVDCFKPLAEFALGILEQRDSIGLTDDMYESGSWNLGSMLPRVSCCIRDIEMATGTHFDRAALLDSRLEVERERARKDPQNDPLRRILRFLIAHWSEVADPYMIHDAMGSLMSATGCWYDTPQERIAFAHLCGSCWNDYQSYANSILPEK